MAKRVESSGAVSTAKRVESSGAVSTVRIENVTRKRTLHARARVARSALAKAIGLMLRWPGPEDALVFIFTPPATVRFHMLFVFGPIDILALDRMTPDGRGRATGRVLALKERFAPWTLWHPRVAQRTDGGQKAVAGRVVASMVIELPAGTIARTGTKVGDRISVSAWSSW